MQQRPHAPQTPWLRRGRHRDQIGADARGWLRLAGLFQPLSRSAIRVDQSERGQLRGPLDRRLSYVATEQPPPVRVQLDHRDAEHQPAAAA